MNDRIQVKQPVLWVSPNSLQILPVPIQLPGCSCCRVTCKSNEVMLLIESTDKIIHLTFDIL